MNLEQLRKFLNELDTQMRGIIAGADKEKGLTEDEATRYDDLEAQFEATKKNIERAEKAEQRAKFMNEPVSKPVTVTQEPKEEERSEIDLLMSYARTGIVPTDKRAITIGNSKGGAYLIPAQYADAILADLKSLTAMRKFATIRKTSGTFNMPIGGSTPTFSWVDEGGTYPTPDTDFTNKTIEAYKAGGIILVAEELLDDESFDLESYLREQIAEGISVTEGEAFISGDGTKKPTGVTVDVAAGLTKTLAALDTISVTDIEDAYLAVPAKARKNGQWIISDKLYKAAFRMKDSTGNYILREGQNGELSTLFGKPFEIDDSMDGAAGKPLAVFGKLEDYVIGDRGEMAIQRLDEKYADEGYVGFKVYKRTDGKLSRNKYVSKLMNAAS